MRWGEVPKRWGGVSWGGVPERWGEVVWGYDGVGWGGVGGSVGEGFPRGGVRWGWDGVGSGGVRSPRGGVRSLRGGVRWGGAPACLPACLQRDAQRQRWTWSAPLVQVCMSARPLDRAGAGCERGPDRQPPSPHMLTS